ncbi:putative rta1 domain protein [Botrytis fragariae]|uniref:Putative rta1 domain protein n=1 Tax=Botrytis fragariae TaxID=1964551 RepID=A0A8H6B241_9HELO|nr:putative rta1 domain protein [Botrytis fragariae]KAF5877700.1 putative rta1 domain protein [Botrytis fragariae]
MPVANVCKLGTCPLEYGMVHYQPTLFGNVFYLGIFAALLMIHIIQLWRWKAWSFSCCILLGLVLGVVGYFGRVQMHYDPFASNPFLICVFQYLICVTIAPVFFTASIYITYSRVLLHFGPHLSRFSPKAISVTFMAADWIALILQAAGGAITDTAATEAGMKSGTDILVAGLSFQVFGLILFMMVAVEYSFKVRGERTRRQAASWAAGESKMGASERKMRYLCYGLTVATVLILIRSIFRVAELAKGFQSKLANEEIPFMILESAVMISATTIMTIFHPGLIIRGKWKESGWELKGWKNEQN